MMKITSKERFIFRNFVLEKGLNEIEDDQPEDVRKYIRDLAKAGIVTIEGSAPGWAPSAGARKPAAEPGVPGTTPGTHAPTAGVPPPPPGQTSPEAVLPGPWGHGAPPQQPPGTNPAPQPPPMPAGTLTGTQAPSATTGAATPPPAAPAGTTTPLGALENNAPVVSRTSTEELADAGGHHADDKGRSRTRR